MLFKSIVHNLVFEIGCDLAIWPALIHLYELEDLNADLLSVEVVKDLLDKLKQGVETRDGLA